MNTDGEHGRGLPVGQVKNSVADLRYSDKFYEQLVSLNFFQLGYKTRCTHCQRSSWHDLASFSSGLACPLCFEKLNPVLAIDSGQKGGWHLKTSGPFSVGKYADGSFSVLLLLHQLERSHSLQLTPAFSFEATKNETLEIEADFGALWQQMVHGEKHQGILFAECKSYNEFKSSDFLRMATLAKSFPGAILAFCTLRTSLKPAEIRAIRKIAKSGLKQWKTERPNQSCLGVHWARTV